MYRPLYHEPHDDRDWEQVCAETVDAQETTIDTTIDTTPIDPHEAWTALMQAEPPVSRSTRVSTERLIADYRQPDTRDARLAPAAIVQAAAAVTVVLDEIKTAEPAIEPPAKGAIVLDALQEQAIADCSEHLFTHISGTAGVGKTHVAKEIMKRYPGVVLAATTGIASVNLGEGTTINALLHYFNTAMLKSKHLEGQLKRQIDWLRRSGVRRILIDEKSMMAGDQLTYITRAVRESNEQGVYALEEVGTGEQASENTRDEPPHMGITLVGDFGQLPPVPDEEEYRDPKTQERKWKKLPVRFAFDSPEWPLYAAHTTRLTTIYRQDQKDFIAALHAVRAGDVVSALRFFTPDKFVSTQDDTFEGATIFPKNDQVDRYNQLRLDRLTGATMIARSIRQGEQRPDWKLIPETLVLKEGALVMLLANRRVYDDGDVPRLIYANGDLATLLGKDQDGAWLARLKRNGVKVTVYPVTRENMIPLVSGRRKEIKLEIKAQLKNEGFRFAHELNDDDYEDDTSYVRAGRSDAAGAVDVWDSNGPIDDEEIIKAREKEEFGKRLATCINDQGKGKFEIIGTITYLPARAAYACTVHKTQGLTLDAVQVNIRDSFMGQAGMLFVALSRARTAEGLKIVGDQSTFVQRCRTEPRVQKWL